ncbi:alanine racemase [Candidatus Tokpelaia sp.]|uniref:alanine racemase n=1 Tax=Candidatus Tokpelaia sp. TaxID=2233777 RepID=UPI00123999FC|nr:alanine racemase [Candidatus Tokpelaia sp.]KAA6405806.1 alanine racemase [Candidatus Tokpelaia sp.]
MMVNTRIFDDKTGGSGVLTVNLAALQHNYKALQERARGAVVAAVVKADAYGLGAAAIASALYEAGCRLFFVAQPAEAAIVQAALAAAQAVPAGRSKKQQSGSKAADKDKVIIAILNGVLPHEAAAAARAGFVPVLNSIDSVREWAALNRAERRKLPAMLQCDSGMARLGLDKNEIKALLAAPEILAEMEVIALIGHLSCADIEQSPINAAQAARFLADAENLAKALHYRPPLSLSASSGLALGAEFYLDIVRPGLALYGLVEGGNRAGKLEASLRPVITLEAGILRLGQVQKGETIGYGATYKATKSLPTATLSAGYADGWPRSLSNKGAVFYRGVRLPLIGRISMDCMVADLSPLLDAGQAMPARGDWVELIGEHQSPHDIAQAAGTIAYEILTSLGRRYQRRYCFMPPDRVQDNQ